MLKPSKIPPCSICFFPKTEITAYVYSSNQLDVFLLFFDVKSKATNHLFKVTQPLLVS